MFKFIKRLFGPPDKKIKIKLNTKKLLNTQAPSRPRTKRSKPRTSPDDLLYDPKTFKKDLQKFFSTLTEPPIKKIHIDREIIAVMMEDAREGFLIPGSFTEAFSEYNRRMPEYILDVQPFGQFARTETFMSFTRYPDLGTNPGALSFITEVVRTCETQADCPSWSLPSKTADVLLKLMAVEELEATPDTLSAYFNDHYRVADLKEIAKKHNLKISGNKQQLIDRIIDAGVGAPKAIYRPVISRCRQIAEELCHEYINAAKNAVASAGSEDLIREAIDACQDESPCWDIK